jgi:uncharacterized protein YrrD
MKMLTGRQLLGLTVRDNSSGKSAGRICDIFGDPKSGRIRGFGVSGDTLFSRQMLLPASAVESIGIRGVIADVSSMKRLRAKGDTLLAWRGALLRSEQGKDLGIISDVILDEGRVAALEISGGVLADVADRRSVVSWDSVEADKDGGFIRF